MKLLNTGLCAACTYTAVYSKLGKAYAAMLKWIEENQSQIAFAPFDVYLNAPKDVKSPEKLIMQMWFPIRK